jgi:hypothetical protein
MANVPTQLGDDVITPTQHRFPRLCAAAAGILSAAISIFALPLVFREAARVAAVLYPQDPAGGGVADAMGFFPSPMLIAVDVFVSIGIGLFVGFFVFDRLQGGGSQRIPR